MKRNLLYFIIYLSVFSQSCKTANTAIDDSAEPDMKNKAAEYRSKTPTGADKLAMSTPDEKLKNNETPDNTTIGDGKNSKNSKPKKTKVRIDTEAVKMLDALAVDLREIVSDEQVDFSRTPEGMTIVFNPGIGFKYTSETLTDEAKGRLDNIIKVLDRYPYTDIMVEGHADSTGNVPRNKVLSETRAKNVALYMKSSGIKSERLAIAGYGATKPIASNRTEEGRALNRRVLIRIKVDEKKVKKNEK